MKQKHDNAERGIAPDLSREAILESRRRRIGRNLSLSYQEPLLIVRGEGQYLYDASGRAYLDCVNNVCHVGHSHPRLAEAAGRQMSVLNTNTRYLHPYIVLYAEELTARLPAPLEVCFFVNSGSEANDLALRLARAHTGRRAMVVIDQAYHGHTGDLIEISPYKFEGPGGMGKPPHTHVVALPDSYRGLYRGSLDETGEKYVAQVRSVVRELEGTGEGMAGFIAESMVGCGGQIELPDGYLRGAFEAVREAGGVCIVDEVQVGMGRVGSHFWGFETQEVVPDIVTMGKPIGNGHPLAAVVTTAEIAESFANGMEYFNTFGGNPVSCAIGRTVLEIIDEEGLQEHAWTVGEHLKGLLRSLQMRHPIIGDVRGLGLFLGVELVRNRKSLEPAGEEASRAVELMKEKGILLSTDGPDHNVIKIKPPLVFSRENAEEMAAALDQVLGQIRPDAKDSN